MDRKTSKFVDVSILFEHEQFIIDRLEVIGVSVTLNFFQFITST